MVPGFSPAVADQVVAWLNDCYARYGDCSDRAEWDGDVIVVHSPLYEDEDGYQPERVAADDDGRFYIGAARYTWQKTSEVREARPPGARRRRLACTGAGRRVGRSRGPGRGRG